MLFYQVGEFFQSLAVERSRKSISDLMDIRPDCATVRRNGELITISPESVAIGEIIIVTPWWIRCSFCHGNRSNRIFFSFDWDISCFDQMEKKDLERLRQEPISLINYLTAISLRKKEMKFISHPKESSY